MDRTCYEDECDRKLNDAKFYRKQDEAITNQTQQRVTTYVQRMLKDGHIAEMTDQYLIYPTVILGRFSILPKIHKTTNPGRPSITSNSHPTERISQFVDYHCLPSPLSWIHTLKTGGSLGELKKLWLCSHSISRSPKLVLVFL